MRVKVTKQIRSSKSRPSPSGVPNHKPLYNIAPRKRTKFLNRWIRKLATPAGRIKIHAELRRRIRFNRHWVNKPNPHGVDATCELMLAIFDDLDLSTWQTRHNLATLAERAGLKTGDKTISRASRGCDRLSWLDLILTEKAPFNPYDAQCACKRIDVTESFFVALGIPLKQVYRERARLTPDAAPEEIIQSWDARLVVKRLENIARMAAAGLARMKARRDAARQRKKEYYSPSLA